MYIYLDFEYSVQGLTTENEQIKLAGKNSITFADDYEAGNYVDVGMFFAAACEETMSHFHTFKIEKEGKELAEVTVKIRNLIPNFTG
ncbi:MAG: hypothetical protein H0T73_02090 [Ardenticatenales bacterium]|nr:hypothetical protein [Ardenticatenales bacterium]